MEQSWIDSVGRISLYGFSMFIVASLAGIGLWRAWERRRAGVGERPASPGSRAWTFLLGYVGNIDSPPDALETIERRSNWQARMLMDYIQEAMVHEGSAPGDGERVVDELRRSMQEGNRDPTR